MRINCRQVFAYILSAALLALLLIPGGVIAAEYWQGFYFQPDFSFIYQVEQGDEGTGEVIDFDFSMGFSEPEEGKLKAEWEGEFPMGDETFPFAGDFVATKDEDYLMKLFEEGMGKDLGGSLLLSILAPSFTLFGFEPDEEVDMDKFQIELELGREYEVVQTFQAGEPEDPIMQEMQMEVKIVDKETFNVLDKETQEEVSIEGYLFEITADTDDFEEIEHYRMEILVAPNIPLPLYILQEVTQVMPDYGEYKGRGLIELKELQTP